MSENIKCGTCVYIKDGSGLPEHLRIGTVVGLMISEQPIIGKCYAVDVGEKISDVYPYPVVGVFEIHLREATLHEANSIMRLNIPNVNNY